MIFEAVTLVGTWLAGAISEQVPVIESFNDRENALNDHFMTDLIYGSLAAGICFYMIKY